MNSRFATVSTLLFVITALVASSVTVAQLSETPPVSMGLWQTETNSTVTGIENTPMAGMANALARSHTTHSCLTSESWKKDIQGFNARQQNSCTMSNLHQDAREVSFDESCGSADTQTQVHVDILIDSADHAHGTVITKMVNPEFPQPMTVTVNMVSHYLGADCGGIKPGQAKLVNK